MVTTATDLREAGIGVPLLVGGAALSEKFTRQKSHRNMHRRLLRQGRHDRPAPDERIERPFGTPTSTARTHPRGNCPAEEAGATTLGSPRRRALTRHPHRSAHSEVAYLDRKVAQLPTLNEIWSYINPYMLFGRHLGFRGNFEKALAERDSRALELLERHGRDQAERPVLHENRSCVAVLRSGTPRKLDRALCAGREFSDPHFPFSPSEPGSKLCLSDYILPTRDGHRDHLALFVVTAGAGIRQKSEEAKEAGRYSYSHGLQALALESAEACAEWLHRRIREDWGFPDPPAFTMPERFTSRFRGKRYSFGYPACPNLEDQAGIWMLLRPDEIGVHLTEGMMMDPEASVSALVFHHPDCTYFSPLATSPIRNDEKSARD